MNRVFRLTDIGKAYGSREVLKNISLEIEPEHISAILGPNGSGKTTLLKIMALLTPPEQGTIEIMGQNVMWKHSKKLLLDLRRRMAMVTQPVYMFQGSVFDNVAYGLKVRGISGAEQHRHVQKSLALMNMQDFTGYPARRLSAGEKQKVAIARALVLEPEVLFLDEPTANIDSASAIDIEKNIKIIRDEYKSNIIIVTHNVFQARRVADRILMLWDGELIESNETAALFKDPQDHRTSAFICGDLYF